MCSRAPRMRFRTGADRACIARTSATRPARPLCCVSCSCCAGRRASRPKRCALSRPSMVYSSDKRRHRTSHLQTPRDISVSCSMLVSSRSVPAFGREQWNDDPETTSACGRRETHEGLGPGSGRRAREDVRLESPHRPLTRRQRRPSAAPRVSLVLFSEGTCARDRASRTGRGRRR